MQWIDVHRQSDLDLREQALQQCRRQAQTQVQLLFRGILNWDIDQLRRLQQMVSTLFRLTFKNHSPVHIKKAA